MVDECCGSCSEFKTTVVDFKRDASNKESAKNSSHFLLNSLDTSSDFTFPIYGNSLQDSYKGGFGYVPVIESSGVAFIVYPDSTQQNTMFNATIRILPVLLLPMVTAYAAAVIIWILERTGNANDFHPSFIRGTWEGLWWSFVTMTTLGYGDRAPLSYKGRFFSIVWMYFGLVIIAVTMAMLTSTRTTDILKSTTKIYGSKIAAEQNSPEYHLGKRRNAKYEPGKEYHSLDEVTEALLKREVQGILVDAYSAGLRNDLFSKFEVIEIVDYKTAYGIVLSPRSTSLRKCFHRSALSFKPTEDENLLYFHEIPSKPPEIAEPVVLDSISVRLRWRPNPNEFHNGIIRGYRISYERLVNGTKQEKTTVPPARTVMLLNLDKATKYHGKILAYTNAGDGKEANFTFKTAVIMRTCYACPEAKGKVVGTKLEHRLSRFPFLVVILETSSGRE
ncbi:uncharacterized protein [Montipora capricornis]|uniref:uncharacterized protein n=1 Tax=Montipora capricornis TaxID=246305 RepID=UPI0035F14F4F